MTARRTRRLVIGTAVAVAAALFAAPAGAGEGTASGTPFPDLSGLDLGGSDPVEEPAAIPFPDLSGLDLGSSDPVEEPVVPDLADLDLSGLDLSGLDLGSSDPVEEPVVPDLADLDLSGLDLSGLDLGSSDPVEEPVVPDLADLDLSGLDLSGLDLGSSDPVEEPVEEPAAIPFPDMSGLDLSGLDLDPAAEPAVAEPNTVPYPDIGDPAIVVPARPAEPAPSGPNATAPAPETAPTAPEPAPVGDPGTPISFTSLGRSIADTASAVQLPPDVLIGAALWLVVLAVFASQIGRRRVMHSITGVREGMLVPAYTKPGNHKRAEVAFSFRHDATKIWPRGSAEGKKGNRWVPVDSPVGKVWISKAVVMPAHRRAEELVAGRLPPVEPPTASEIAHDFIDEHGNDFPLEDA